MFFDNLESFQPPDVRPLFRDPDHLGDAHRWTLKLRSLIGDVSEDSFVADRCERVSEKSAPRDTSNVCRQHIQAFPGSKAASRGSTRTLIDRSRPNFFNLPYTQDGDAETRSSAEGNGQVSPFPGTTYAHPLSPRFESISPSPCPSITLLCRTFVRSSSTQSH